MSCCGRQVSLDEGSRATRPRNRERHFFRYVGTSAATVQGPASGLVYHFVAPGAILECDPVDAAALAHVPVLERIP